MTFRELGLNSLFADRLDRAGIREPTEIQAEVFGPVSSGSAVLALSKTGTGKTFAYMLPLLQKDAPEGDLPRGGALEVVVLVPTRELAVQVSRSLELVTESAQTGVVIVGGEDENRQISAARQARWVIATPGRLLDLLKRRAIDLSGVKSVVFDEADRLLDMGFVDDMRAIMKLLPKGLQLLFYSATLHYGVDEMAYEFGADFKRFGQEEEELTVEGLDHRISFVGDHEKFHCLAYFIKARSEARGIVFSNYRDKAHDIAQRLKGLGCKAEVLTAQLTQAQRNRIMDAFRSGGVQVLIASDLAARGLDVFDLDFVVNYDLPEDPVSYVHRVGRTARAGRSGLAVSFVGHEDAFRFEKLEKFLGKKMERYEFKLEEMSGELPRFGPRVMGEDTRVERGPRREGPRGRGTGRGGAHGRFEGRPEGRHEGRRHEQQPGPGRAPYSPAKAQAGMPAQRQTASHSHAPSKGLWAGVKALFAKFFGRAPKKGPGLAKTRADVVDTMAHLAQKGRSSGRGVGAARGGRRGGPHRRRPPSAPRATGSGSSGS